LVLVLVFVLILVLVSVLIASLIFIRHDNFSFWFFRADFSSRSYCLQKTVL
jgi:ABC-type phosphate transport system permease subunit